MSEGDDRNPNQPPPLPSTGEELTDPEHVETEALPAPGSVRPGEPDEIVTAGIATEELPAPGLADPAGVGGPPSDRDDERSMQLLVQDGPNGPTFTELSRREIEEAFDPAADTLTTVYEEDVAVYDKGYDEDSIAIDKQNQRERAPISPPRGKPVQAAQWLDEEGNPSTPDIKLKPPKAEFSRFPESKAGNVREYPPQGDAIDDFLIRRFTQQSITGEFRGYENQEAYEGYKGYEQTPQMVKLMGSRDEKELFDQLAKQYRGRVEMDGNGVQFTTWNRSAVKEINERMDAIAAKVLAMEIDEMQISETADVVVHNSVIDDVLARRRIEFHVDKGDVDLIEKALKHLEINYTPAKEQEDGTLSPIEVAIGKRGEGIAVSKDQVTHINGKSIDSLAEDRISDIADSQSQEASWVDAILSSFTSRTR